MTKAWAKRMIWFFGLEIINQLNTLVHYITKIPEVEMNTAAVVLMIAMYIVPMIIMRDDKQ